MIQPVSPFDSIKQARDGLEYWSARQLMPLLGYSRWHDFREAINRAQVACSNSGQEAAQNFSGSTLKTQGRPAEDVHLTRYACYLTAMNGDPRKPEVAAAQAYFTQQTRKAEIEQARPVLSADPIMAQLELVMQMRSEQLALASEVQGIAARLDMAPITSEKVGVIFRLGQQLGQVMGSYQQAWGIFKAKFGLASYRDLPANRYDEAVQFLRMQQAAYSGRPLLEIN